MEEIIINKLRKIKKINYQNYKNEIKYIDIKSESIVPSDMLKTLLNYALIDEEITEIIYAILGSKNS